MSSILRTSLLAASLAVGSLAFAPSAFADNHGNHAAQTTESQTVVEIAAGNPDFSTLVAAVQAAGLAETLSGEGPFTVFAPTNAAFAALPAGTVENLLKPENKDQLVAILTYHVVPGRVLAADVAGLDTATTVNGAAIDISANGGVKVNNANVTATDIQGSNGVIHVIDAVILPPQQ